MLNQIQYRISSLVASSSPFEVTGFELSGATCGWSSILKHNALSSVSEEEILAHSD